MKKGISILGSTGSIGTQTLEVISAFPNQFKVVALAAIDDLEEQIQKFSPKMAVTQDGSSAEKLISKLSKNTKTTIYFGSDGLTKAATHPEADIVVVAIPGIAALNATLSAIRAKKTIALASKEILVAAGAIVMAEARKYKAEIFPVDSEHSAVYQCLKGEDIKRVKRIILTASGGAFRDIPLKELEKVTPAEALSHPTWKMGKKVTIDSATLMNKGFEVIEAHHLFSMPYTKIDVLVHPQSIVHSMVEYLDGSVIAQLSCPDMRLPIQYALFRGERMEGSWPTLDLIKASNLTFLRADTEKFPCLKLAYDAGFRGGALGAALNGADEEAVRLFLEGKIKFTDIAKIVSSVLEEIGEIGDESSLDDILALDDLARKKVLKKTVDK